MKRARLEKEHDMKKFAILAGAALLAFTSPAPAEDSGLSDAQIAHIAFTAGQLDIDAARQALERSRNAEVRAFAETMLRDHQAVNAQALALLQRLGVTPQEHATSAALSNQAAAERQRLAALAGAGVVVAGDLLGTPYVLTAVAGWLFCFALRVVAIRRGWHLPVAERREPPPDGSTGA